MEEEKTRQLREESLTFFGRVTAGQSHEVTNVLNIINEFAGLQQDVLYGAEKGNPADLEKLKKIAEKIQSQVKRGETIIKEMNHFAHSVDVPVSVFDVEDALDRILFLAERSARLKKTELVAELPEESITIENSPFALKHAVYTCIEAALLSVAEHRRVYVGFRVVAGGVEFSISSADSIADGPELEAKKTFLERQLDELGGELRELPETAGKFRFFIPGSR